MNRAVFLDRDDTIIHDEGYLSDPARVRMIRGAASAIVSLRGLGYRVVVVTNQSGVARGKMTEQDVEAVNQRVAELVRQQAGGHIDRFYYCPHHPEGTVAKYQGEHPWRKPQPGMLLQAAQDLDLDLASCWLVGDQPRDIAAGKAAGVRTVLLKSGDGPTSDAPEAAAAPDFVAGTLIEAVRLIAQQPRRPERAGAELPPAAPLRTMAPEPPSAPVQRSGPAARSALVQWAAPAQPAAPEGPPASTTEGAPALVELLKAILGELKHHRADFGDFSLPKMVAVLLQMIALSCALYGLIHISDPPIFLQWFAGAGLAQLLVITLLLFRGRR